MKRNIEDVIANLPPHRREYIMRKYKELLNEFTFDTQAWSPDGRHVVKCKGPLSPSELVDKERTYKPRTFEDL